MYPGGILTTIKIGRMRYFHDREAYFVCIQACLVCASFPKRLSLQQNSCLSSENENIQETVMVTGNPICGCRDIFFVVSRKDQDC
jgi:hypothetical protein